MEGEEGCEVEGEEGCEVEGLEPVLPILLRMLSHLLLGKLRKEGNEYTLRMPGSTRPTGCGSGFGQGRRTRQK